MRPGSCAETSPLGWAVMVYVRYERRRSERFGGKHPSLELNSKSHDGVADQGHLSGLCVDHLSGQAHGAGGQRHCNIEKAEKETLVMETLTLVGILGYFYTSVAGFSLLGQGVRLIMHKLSTNLIGNIHFLEFSPLCLLTQSSKQKKVEFFKLIYDLASKLYFCIYLTLYSQ